MMRWRIVIALTLVAAGLGFAPRAATAAATPVIAPVRACADLVGDFGIPGAATRVTSATVVPAAAGVPEHCDVRGTVAPAVRFQLRLPTRSYAGRYLQYGCHGLCGTIFPPAVQQCGPQGGDLAVAATDDGHVGQGEFPFPIMDGRWAANDRSARDDYFFRAPHVVSVAAKRIIASFYGAPPAHSYFSGCSTGGREGLLLAQRYPDDFDGIIAGSPAAYMGPLFGVYFTWLAKANNRADGTPIITAAKLPALHNAVLAACDRLDGLADGQIDDPRACRYDPAALRCPPGADRPDCLTPHQVTIARRLYDGPRDPRGRRLYPGWESRGSELAWEASIIPHPQYGSITPLPDNYLKYVGYPIGTPHSSVAGFRFTVAELNRLTAEGVKGNAMSLDLSRFRRSGGKLILWHGWDDQSIPAIGTLDYYERLSRHNGGTAATRTWARAFMVPSKYHCDTGGYRLTAFDPFRELVGWVEHGTAPEKVVATGTDEHGAARTRPVFAYPVRARYDGSGSVNDAANFVPAPPVVPPHDTISWAGSYLHGIPGPVAR